MGAIGCGLTSLLFLWLCSRLVVSPVGSSVGGVLALEEVLKLGLLGIAFSGFCVLCGRHHGIVDL